MIPLPPHDHCVYQLIDRTGQVIYVGSSSAVFARLASHAKNKDWWTHVRAVEIESFISKDDMLDREQDLIEMISPVHNDTYGLESALTMGSALLGEKVTREDVRRYVARRMSPGAPQETASSEVVGVSLRDYAMARGVDAGKLKEWRRAHTETFPEPVGQGPNRTALYAWDDLDLFCLTRNAGQ